jgi:hypothetical protein
MSFNPNRLNPSNAKFKKRQNARGGGVSHSAVARGKGVGDFAPSNAQEPTAHGIRIPSFLCDEFVTYYECLFSGNNTGFGLSADKNKTVCVLSGTVYITTAATVKTENGWEVDNDTKTMIKVNAGAHASFPAGTAYSLATTGKQNVEMLVTTSIGYDDSFIPLEESISKPGKMIMKAPEGPVKARVNSQKEKDVVASQFARRQRQRGANVGKRTELSGTSSVPNVNSSTVIGVNPMPFRFTDE